MNISTKHYGGSFYSKSIIIEVTIEYGGHSMTIDVTDNKSEVDEDLIQNFRDIADELEEQNRRLKL
tara:strand:+ start:1589 stop:1786 length:198 start_codon:yes stop_codon:yes gene_type:complete